MTFPLGSLRYDGGADTPSPVAARAPGWRDQLALLAGAVAWLLVVLALATHSAADPGFSTSGGGGPVQNKAGMVGAWLSDVAFFLVGYSVWWAVLVGARAWLGGLARVLRAHAGAPQVAETPAWHLWLGLGLLLRGASCLGAPALSSLATHALTVGAIGGLTLAMMARVSLGHTGRMLTAPPAMRLAFAAMNLAALVRCFGPLIAPTHYMAVLVTSGTLWSLAFATFAATYLPVLLQPRVDGRPG